MVKNQPRPGKAFGLVFSSNSHGDVIIMPYKDRLESWAVIRLLPKMQRVTVARRRTASDAEGCCQILRRLETDAQFIVVFDRREQPS